MKKIAILLACILCLSLLVACNSNEPTEPQNDNTSNTETNEPNISDETNNNTENQIFEKGTISIVDEIQDGAPSFLATFRISGYSKMNLPGNEFFEVTVDSMDPNMPGSLDLDFSKANLLDEITEYFDYLYLTFEFDGKEIVDWDLVDIKTRKSVLSFTNQEMKNIYYPEYNFELIYSGELPEIMNLSNYDVGKTYVFDVGDESFSIPEFINDSQYPLLIVSTRKGINETIDKTYKANKYYPYQIASSVVSEDGKYYISISEGSVADKMESYDCINLDGYNSGDRLQFAFEGFIGNNTNKTYSLKISSMDFDDKEITLLPGEILECNWTRTVVITDVK